MNTAQLFKNILRKRSFLCVGLDSDIAKIPQHLRQNSDSLLQFNRAIVDATAPYAVCYKPNLAFYEQLGAKGWDSFTQTCRYIRTKYPDVFIIADAKRGDIGNTSRMYARAFFDSNLVDAVTLSPYMGYDTVEPFLSYPDKWAVILALTSNPSADDFEMQTLKNGRMLYQEVLERSKSWGNTDNTMYVVGATKAQMLGSIRKIVPHHFLLIPGVGAQGGSLEEVAQQGMNGQCGLLVNSSRGIIYASDGEDFAQAAANQARIIQEQMGTLLDRFLPKP